jgi:cysteine synthase A
MRRLGLEREVVDRELYDRAVARFGERGIALPTFGEIAEPWTVPAARVAGLEEIGPDDRDPRNLWRVHWYNDGSRRERVEVPEHVVLPEELTGTPAKIVVALANRFPLVSCHKVLASYGCLAPRVVAGQFDPSSQRAIWPSTGNYCRGGVAISRLMGCRGVAVLPAGMSRERFEWLEAWVEDPADIIRTPGTESNVKEIYDECNRLALDPKNVIFNQFSEFGNHVVHYFATGKALERVFESLAGAARLAAFVSATGSAGTIAAGDYLKDVYGSDIVAVEALECPTMLYNGFGEHNIQGIGDKHIPLIHNVMNTDVVTAVSDRATDRLNILFNTEAGRRYLTDRRHLPAEVIEALGSLGLSSICNVVASIKYARHFGLGPDDVVATVATDGASMYVSELDLAAHKQYPDGVDEVVAGEIFGEQLSDITDDHLRELDRVERERIFNLGYYTWVEQQGITVEEFEARRRQSFWAETRSIVTEWDEMIREFNERAAAAGPGSHSGSAAAAAAHS